MVRWHTVMIWRPDASQNICQSTNRKSPDERGAELRGGQLIARVGKGNYVFSGYAWFRQLPAGVPGAYRLFANLISLPKAK